MNLILKLLERLLFLDFLAILILLTFLTYTLNIFNGQARSISFCFVFIIRVEMMFDIRIQFGSVNVAMYYSTAFTFLLSSLLSALLAAASTYIVG